MPKIFLSSNFPFSPSSADKKSNGFFQGGLSSIKSAATSMAKKLDEIKDSISANSTPTKSANCDRDRLDDHLDSPATAPHSRRVSSDVDLWSRLSDSRKSSVNNLLFLGEYAKMHTSPLSSTESHPQISLEHTYSKNSSVEIYLNTCSSCNNCGEMMYDKDIMAGWSAEDSNLNTTCHKCKNATVPLLSIQINSCDRSQSNEKQTNQFNVPFWSFN